MSASVDKYGFYQTFRNRGEVRPQNDHVIGADRSRDDTGPQRIVQSHRADRQIGRNQSAGKVHRNQHKHCHQTVPVHMNPRQAVRAQTGHGNIHGQSRYQQGQWILISRQDLVIGQYQLIRRRIKAQRPDQKSPVTNQLRRITEGYH